MAPNLTDQPHYLMHENSPLDLSKTMEKNTSASKKYVARGRMQAKTVKQVIINKRKLAVAQNWISEKNLSGNLSSAETYCLMTTYLVFCKEQQEENLSEAEFLPLLNSENFPKKKSEQVGKGESSLSEDAMDIVDSGCESSDQESNCTKIDFKRSFSQDSVQDSFDKKTNTDSSSYDSGFESNDQDSEKQSDDDDCDSQSDHDSEASPLTIDETISEDTKPVILPSAIKRDPDVPKALPPKIVESLVAANIKSLVNLEMFRECECYDHGSELIKVFMDLLKQDMLGVFLTTFTHSFKCRIKQCSKLCFMFKRILVHITAPQLHKCAVKHVYTHILRIHLDTCQKQDCQLPNCKQLQNKRRLMSPGNCSSPENI